MQMLSKPASPPKFLNSPDEDAEKHAQALVSLVEKEIEPLLQDANPFFGGSDKLTLAEALTAGFALRLYVHSKAGVSPSHVAEGFEKLPKFSKWLGALRAHPSATFKFDEEIIAATARQRKEKNRAANV